MKMIQLLMAVSLSLISTTFNVAHAQSQNEIRMEMDKAASIAVNAYKEGGISGLVIESQECYKKHKSPAYYCLYLDVASRHIDDIFSAALNIQPTPYFSGDQWSSRIVTVLMDAEMDDKTAKKYLETIIHSLKNMVEKKLEK